MTTILRSLLLAGAMAGLITVGGIAVAPAQDKKDTKKDTKTAKAGAGTIKINEGKDGKFRFNVYDADGKYLAGSPVAPRQEGGRGEGRGRPQGRPAGRRSSTGRRKTRRTRRTSSGSRTSPPVATGGLSG